MRKVKIKMLDKLSMYYMFLFPVSYGLRSCMCSLQSQHLQSHLTLLLRISWSISLIREVTLLWYSHKLPQTQDGMSARKYTSKDKWFNMTAAVCSHSSRGMRTWLTPLTEQLFRLHIHLPARVMAFRCTELCLLYDLCIY